jgi:hypothetical protein
MVIAGFVRSPARPGGNITGVSLRFEIDGKLVHRWRDLFRRTGFEDGALDTARTSGVLKCRKLRRWGEGWVRKECETPPRHFASAALRRSNDQDSCAAGRSAGLIALVRFKNRSKRNEEGAYTPPVEAMRSFPHQKKR